MPTSPEEYDRILGLTDPFDKPQSAAEMYTLRDEVARRFTIGRVIDHWPQYHTYLVAMPVGRPQYVGTAEGGSTLGFAQRPLNVLLPGTRVLLYRPHDTVGWTAVAVLPDQTLDYRYDWPDMLVGGSKTTQRDDSPYLDPGVRPEGGLPDFGAGRPLDLQAGETGWINPLGVGLHLGVTQATLKATGLSQLDMFYLDHLVRLHAHNLRLYTGCRELWSGDDEGEPSEVVRFSPFPWEMRGVSHPGVGAFREGDEAGKRKEGRDEDDLEPELDDQTGIFRDHRFSGYLGNGEAAYISAPAPGNPLHESLSSTDREHVGLSEIRRHLNGMIELRSLKGIVLEKASYIPLPTQIADHDDPAGDTADEYAAAGITPGATSETDPGHQHAEPEPDPEDGKSHQAFHAQAYDLLSWFHQSYGLLPFHRHAKDWEVLAEADSRVQGGSHIDPAYASPPSVDDPMTNMPQPYRLKVDHRDESGEGSGTRFYRGRSVFTLLDNGDVVIENAWGSRIAMHGQDITLSCAGDLRLAPGRNLVALAPRDAIVRGGKNVELSSSENDVRIKAQQNLMMMGGNDRDFRGEETLGVGGVLIESRAEVPTGLDSGVQPGVSIKSPGGAFNAYGKGVYVRSLENQDLVLDADEATLQQYCRDKVEFVNTSRMTIFGSDPATGEDYAGYEYADSGSIIFGQDGSAYFATQSIYADRDINVQGSVNVVGNVSGRQVAADTGGRPGEGGTGITMGQRQSSPDQAIESRITALNRRAESVVKPVSQRPSTLAGQPYFDIEDANPGPGLDRVINALGMSFRRENEYRVPLMLVEARWQQFLRQFGNGGQPWYEPPVAGPDGVLTGPYPGYAAWNKETGQYLEVDPQGWSVQAGETHGVQDEPKLGQVRTDKTLADGYLVNADV